MTLRPWLLAFSGVVTAVFLSLPFLPEATQPFDATGVPGTQALRVLPSSRGVRMPEGLEGGDRLYFSDMDPKTRLMFMVGGMNAPAGTPMHLRVQRDGETHDVTVQFMPTTFLGGGTGTAVVTLSDFALSALAAALGLLLLWRGQNRATLGVALWCFSVVLNEIFSGLPLPFPLCAWLSWSGTVLQNIGTFAGLFLVADGLTADGGLSARTLWLLRRVFAAMLAVYVTGVMATNLDFYLHDRLSGSGTLLVISVHMLAFLLPLGMLLTGYRRALPVNRARIRWILFSLTALALSYVSTQVLVRFDLSFIVVNLGFILLKAAAFAGFTYAVLRHSLVSVGIVLNRALVYGLITSLVVGVFATLLSYLERSALSTESNRLLALLIPLLLGMGLNAIKKRVDDYINKLFFRQRRQAEAALAQFARTCGYVEEPEKLLDLTAEQLYRHSRAQGVALYLTDGKNGATLARKRGNTAHPASLDANDMAYLRLRAGDAEVELRGLASALGAEGYAYAMAVRGEVQGIVVCGPRPAESYTQEERRLFAQVAHQVGVALHTLKLQEQHRLLQQVADGAFKSLPSVRARARLLLGERAA